MPEPSREASVEAPGARRPVSARVLAIGSAAAAALLALGAFVAYRQLLHYERHAIEHVPAGAELALRVDLEQVVLFEPVRRHLLPLIDRARLSEAGVEPPPGRLQRLRQAGLNLGLDLREVVFARVQPGDRWLLALGGIFGSGPLLPRIEATLRAEPGAQLRAEQARLILEPSGMSLARADDGVLLIASDAALLERALPPSRAHEAVGLGTAGAASFAALGSWLDRLGPAPEAASAAPPTLRRVTARLALGDPLELSAELDHGTAVDIATARRELELWLGVPAGTADFAPKADWGGERALWARAQLTRASATRISLRTTWQRDELDRATRSLAAWLAPQLQPGRPAAR